MAAEQAQANHERPVRDLRQIVQAHSKRRRQIELSHGAIEGMEEALVWRYGQIFPSCMDVRDDGIVHSRHIKWMYRDDCRGWWLVDGPRLWSEDHPDAGYGSRPCTTEHFFLFAIDGSEFGGAYVL